MSDLTLIAFNTFEFTLTTPLTDNEMFYLKTVAEREDIGIAHNQNGRIILFECDELPEATNILSEMGLIEDIGLIRHIIEYEPQWESLNETSITVDFD